MEEGKISDERSPIMGEITTTTVAVKVDDYSSSSTKPLDFARILKSLLVFSTLGIAFLVLYYSSSDKNGQFVPSLGRLSSSFYGDDNYAVVKDEYYELRKVLEAASTKEKTVILTTLNDAWAEPNSIFDLFLESFRNGNNTAYLLNHLVVVAVDEKAYFRCHELGRLHCYYLKTNESSTMAHEARFMTPIYLDMMWGRLAFLRTILSLGYNFVFTYTDVMWFRDPFPHFTLDSDFQTSCDHFNGNEFNISNAPNNGFVFVRSNNRTIKFYDFWVSSRHTYPRLHEQDVFNKIKSGDFVKQLGVKLRFMDTTYFGGFCERSRDFNKVCTMHANCCIGLDNKIADLNTILKVWKNYLSNNHTTRQPANWRVPHKCHM